MTTTYALKTLALRGNGNLDLGGTVTDESGTNPYGTAASAAALSDTVTFGDFTGTLGDLLSAALSGQKASSPAPAPAPESPADANRAKLSKAYDTLWRTALKVGAPTGNDYVGMGEVALYAGRGDPYAQALADWITGTLGPSYDAAVAAGTDADAWVASVPAFAPPVATPAVAVPSVALP